MAAALAPAKVEAVVGSIAAVAMGKTAAECDATAGKYDTGLDVATNALLLASIIPPAPINVGEIAVAVGIAIRPAPAALANLLLLTTSTAAAACCDFFLADGTL